MIGALLTLLNSLTLLDTGRWLSDPTTYHRTYKKIKLMSEGF
jgi:hypothetical protein